MCPGTRCRNGDDIALSGGVWPGLSGSHGGQADDGIIAQRNDSFPGHVAGSLDGPCVVPLEQVGADEPDDSILVGEDADGICAPQLHEGIVAVEQYSVTEFEKLLVDGELTDSFTVAAYAHARARGLV